MDDQVGSIFRHQLPLKMWVAQFAVFRDAKCTHSLARRACYWASFIGRSPGHRSAFQSADVRACVYLDRLAQPRIFHRTRRGHDRFGFSHWSFWHAPIDVFV